MAAEVEAALPGSRTTTSRGHARAGPAGRNRQAVNGFGRHGHRRRSALHGRRPQSVQPPARRPDRSAGVVGVDGMTAVATTRERRTGRRAGRACATRLDARPRRPRAAIPPKSNCCPITKFFPASDVLILSHLGCAAFGESREQEASKKVAECRLRADAESPIRWHMVGRIQRNKARVDRRLGIRRALGRQRQADHRAGPRGGRRARRRPARPTRCGSTSSSAWTATRARRCRRRSARISSTSCARWSHAARRVGVRRADGHPAARRRPRRGVRAFGRPSTSGYSSSYQQRLGLSAGCPATSRRRSKHGSTCVRVGTALLGQRPLTSP